MMKPSAFRRFSISATWVWLGLFALLPNFGLFLVTLLDRGEQEDYFIPVLTLVNYTNLLDPAFLTILGESLALAAASTFVCLLIGYPFAAFIASTSAKWRPWLLLMVAIPFWTNSLIRTYALIMILQGQGLLSKLLMALGIVDQPVSFMFTNFAVFVGLTYTLLPFMILPLYVSLEKLDRRLLDAAKDLGAGPVRTFRHIMLPLTLPGVVAGCMLVFLPSLGCFYVPEILGGSTSTLIGTHIKNQFLITRDWPQGAAASTILTALLMLLLMAHKLVTRWAAGNKNRDGDVL